MAPQLTCWPPQRAAHGAAQPCAAERRGQVPAAPADSAAAEQRRTVANTPAILSRTFVPAVAAPIMHLPAHAATHSKCHAATPMPVGFPCHYRWLLQLQGFAASFIVAGLECLHRGATLPRRTHALHGDVVLVRGAAHAAPYNKCHAATPMQTGAPCRSRCSAAGFAKR